jgi:drug/metabolite transporter (DMT)-like permease
VGTLLFRMAQGSLSDTINYVCAAHLPLGIVGVINNLGPIVTVILAYFFLHERTGWSDAIFLFLSFLGCIAIVLGAKSDGSDYSTITEAPGMYGALFTCPIMSGAGTIALRKMRKLNT